MGSLADRVRAAREQWVSVEGHEFLIRRPTRLQLSKLAGVVTSDAVIGCVVGWKTPENKLVPGGGGEVPPFDPEAFREWVEDDIDILVGLTKNLKDLIERYSRDKEAAEKN